MSKFDNVVLHQAQFVLLRCGFEASTHPFTNNLHRRISLARVARDRVALASQNKPSQRRRERNLVWSKEVP
jgi:hypothetical protein